MMNWVIYMRMTNYTDYALRVLIYLAAKPKGKRSNINEIATAYRISKHHLSKVIHELGMLGYIDTIRGRGGGIQLALSPDDINIGTVVRNIEDDFQLVACFSNGPSPCVITPVCGLRHALSHALSAYLSVLDDYTLADIVQKPLEYQRLLGIKSS